VAQVLEHLPANDKSWLQIPVPKKEKEKAQIKWLEICVFLIPPCTISFKKVKMYDNNKPTFLLVEVSDIYEDFIYVI
jgi:hypothetical protein